MKKVYMIVDTSNFPQQVFEMAFETEMAAKIYKETWGNPAWCVNPVMLQTETHVIEEIKYLKTKIDC